MVRSLALALLVAAMADGLNIKDVEEPKYAYVTMWVNGNTAPAFVRSGKKSKFNSVAEEKKAFKVMQEEYSLDDAAAFEKREYPTTNLVDRLGGSEIAHMGAVKMAQMLKKHDAKYPLILLTNDAKLLAIDDNSTNQAMYSNVIIKKIEDADWLKHECKLKEGNGIHFQKLSIFGMTDYDKLLWLDTDLVLRKNMDELFEFDLGENGQMIYGQQDDYGCNQANYGSGFCSGIMLFSPKANHLPGLIETAKSMDFCWGDQRIITKYFKQTPRQPKIFKHNVINWGHCNWRHSNPMAVHNQHGMW